LRQAEVQDKQPGAGAAPAAQRMHAGVYRGKGRVDLEEVPVPTIGRGEVLIRVSACGICGTDVKKIQHGFIPPPQIFGHEIAGVVAAIGPGVDQWREGDRVVTFHHIPCRTCFYCRRRLFSQCPVYKKVGVTAGFDPNGGGFSQYVRVMPWIAEAGMIRIPEDVSFEEATFVEPVNTCLKAVEKARVEAGECVVVLGQGPIGLLLLLLARQAGATVLSVEPMPERRGLSLQFGAAASVDPRSGDARAELLERTDGRGADVVLVAVPAPEAVGQALAMARPGGRVLLFAQNDPLMKLHIDAVAIGVEEKEVLGSYSASVDLQEVSARLVFERRLPLTTLISHRFPLHQIQEGLALAARPTGTSLKILIMPT
jgi:L-iditol 2-dehydrogenase